MFRPNKYNNIDFTIHYKSLHQPENQLAVLAVAVVVLVVASAAAVAAAVVAVVVVEVVVVVVVAAVVAVAVAVAVVVAVVVAVAVVVDSRSLVYIRNGSSNGSSSDDRQCTTA